MPKFASLQEVIDSLSERFNPAAAAGVDATIQLNYTGEGGGDWYLIVENQTLQVEEGTTEDPDLTVNSSADDWLKVANGEANPMALMMTGKLKIKGAIPLAMKFGSFFGLT